jgi:hypothetical protein
MGNPKNILTFKMGLTWKQFCYANSALYRSCEE